VARRGHSGAIRGCGSPGLQAGEDVHKRGINGPATRCQDLLEDVSEVLVCYSLECMRARVTPNVIE